MTDKTARIIAKRTKEVGKTYGFQKDHNPRIPADYWFQNPVEGLLLFIVFYTQACRWAKCLGCNLPSQVSQEHVCYKDILKQVDFIFHNVLSDEQKKDLRKIIVSNNGSVLDERTFSTTALFYFITKMNLYCPKISVLTLETRPEYAQIAELELLARAIQEGDTPTKLELAIGFEAFDNKIRNEHFIKGLEIPVFERFAADVAKHKHRLKTYFMLKPIPNLSEEDAIADIADAIKYLDNISRDLRLEINMHLNPTYAAKGTPLEKAFYNGTFVPPRLESVIKTVLTGKKSNISIYVGLDDEGLAVEGGSFIRDGDEELIQKLMQFNKTQDYSVLQF